MKAIVKKILDEKSEKHVKKYVDKVKILEDGWKIRYYKEKFHVDQEDMQEFLANIRQVYMEGLQWVYSYYYQGCVSWTWFYPFHYAPFAADLVASSKPVEINFEMGTPASPFE